MKPGAGLKLCDGIPITLAKRDKPLDKFYRFESFIHVANSKIEAKVHHGVSRWLVSILKANKVSHCPSSYIRRGWGGHSCWSRCHTFVCKINYFLDGSNNIRVILSLMIILRRGQFKIVVTEWMPVSVVSVSLICCHDTVGYSTTKHLNDILIKEDYDGLYLYRWTSILQLWLQRRSRGPQIQ